MTNSQAFPMHSAIDTIVAIPALNEAFYIENVIADLMTDQPHMRRAELWIIDGGSIDGTREIVGRIAASNPCVRLLHNREKIQACAVNLAALEARRRSGVKYLVRADAHARYPDRWIGTLIAAAEETGADSIVVPMRTCGGGPMRDASADLFNSWLGNGGSAHRSGVVRGFVDHGHHALFRLEAFLEAGGYDPRFLANEDAEFDMRLGNIGRRIFLENRAAIDYFPRDTLSGVFRQFFRNGRYRLCTSLKHGRRPGLRQLAPIFLSIGFLLSLTAGFLVHPAFALLAGFYVIGVFVASSVIASRKTPTRITLIAVTAITAHLAFGFGALSTLLFWIGNNSLPLPGTAQPSVQQ
ncbi:MAG: glycosyltransferase family 2 protein [Pseudomonadota bacterium]|nr:glycosyltransferase family 2 protein [Pseudomonadota bacterium]